MIEITNVEAFNFEGAFRGLRNPMNSWDKSDSLFGIAGGRLGPKDLDLAQRMIKGGNEEAKFLRQIFVSMDINAPIFWWKEMDTYKVGTTANSCSTMHTIHKTPISKDMFSFSNFNFNQDMIYDIIDICEILRQKYNETKDKNYWRALIEILPMGFNQKRTWTANYQVLRNIYFQRRHHKLDEWHTFCEQIESLPYGKELICYKGE